MNSSEGFIRNKLNERREAGNYRELRVGAELIDFCSNDYLGFARSSVLKGMVLAETESHHATLNGSTGSRLLTGNTSYAEQLEREIAHTHGFESGLIFNSGYDANLGLLSSVPQRGDTIILDELAHASLIDGARLSNANRFSFRHNDLESLESKLKNAKGNCYVVVESVYSMDGDLSPLLELIALVDHYGANLIVDEAHAIGAFGLGLLHQNQLQPRVFATVVTFGKAMGCHGAIVLGSGLLKQYLVNFARSFIYTTAAPFHQLAVIKMAYELLKHSEAEQLSLRQNIHYLDGHLKGLDSYQLSDSSAIRCLVIGDNQKARNMAAVIQNAGMDVRPILSPTVATGTERLRICLHSYNTLQQLDLLVQVINTFKH